MMYRPGLVMFSLAATIALLPAEVLPQQQRRSQQPPKPAKELVLGSWNLLLADGVKDDGTHVPLFGPNPAGILIFAPDGHYAAAVMRSNLAPFASNNRRNGTAYENKATVQGTFADFGRYTVDDVGKSISFRVDGSAFPNEVGTLEKNDVTAITDEVLTYIIWVPVPGFTHGEVVWKKNK